MLKDDGVVRLYVMMHINAIEQRRQQQQHIWQPKVQFLYVFFFCTLFLQSTGNQETQAIQDAFSVLWSKTKKKKKKQNNFDEFFKMMESVEVEEGKDVRKEQKKNK